MADPPPERIAQGVANLRGEVEVRQAIGITFSVRVPPDDAAALLDHIDALTGDLADLHARYDGLTTVLAQVQRERDEARRALAAALAHDSVASGDLDRARAARDRGEVVTLQDVLEWIAACPACAHKIDHQHATPGEPA